MKVELIEKFNIPSGTLLVVKSNAALHVGDEIMANDEKYTIKSFMLPGGAFDPDLISVIV